MTAQGAAARQATPRVAGIVAPLRRVAGPGEIERMMNPAEPASRAEIEAAVEGRHENPFGLLGLHLAGDTRVLRAFVPDAETLFAETLSGRPLGTLERRHDAGFFEGVVPLRAREPVRLHATRGGDHWSLIDPYSFGPVLGPEDDYYFREGTHRRAFDRLGAHPMVLEGVDGVFFAVWAPNARRVSVVGDFNLWDGRRHVMRRRSDSGLWEFFIPGAQIGQFYKFELLDAQGQLLPLKADPFAFHAEMRPGSASRIANTKAFDWTDGEWLHERRSRDPRHHPLSIYEVHAGSWKRKDGNGFLSYDELADDLIPYVVETGFTHIELLPITEHPFDESWGYQPTGFFAPTSRFGDPDGFARFVNRAHAAGIGVILDWVPAHFPTDDHGLLRFDGTALYEHEDPRQGLHPDWNTAIFNYGRAEVQNFLINSALFWIERYHVDGLRVDAVASMLYLDYSRKAGEWIPNRHQGRENLEAIDFLRRLNDEVHRAAPGVLMIAEESTSFPGVTRPTSEGGLGFGFKWNMGFMHDTLQFLRKDPIHRKHHHDKLTFGLLYAFAENFLLPLSHDEVVHCKGSLIGKLFGDADAKFASLRSYLAFMWAYPGKKLLFMGQEFASWNEWSESKSLDWHLMEHAPHRGMQRLVSDLNRFHRDLPSLHARDGEQEGFEWLVVHDNENSIAAWARHSGFDDRPVVAVTNFTPVGRTDYDLPLPRAGRWREILNTNSAHYAGTGEGNFGTVEATPHHSGKPARARIFLPPLSTLYLVFEADR